MKITRMLSTMCDNNNQYCPAVFLTETGDIAIVGTVAGADVHASIPEGAGVGENELLVTVPRELLIAAGWSNVPDGKLEQVLNGVKTPATV